MIDCGDHRQEFRARLDSARSLVTATASTAPDVSKEGRGLAVVLLYAAYENLLTSICRTLLEAAKSTRAKNKRLKPGFKLFAVHDRLTSISDIGPKGIWKNAGHALIESLYDSQNCTIDTDLFPADGSNMRTSQIETICKLFALGSPAPVLKNVWPEIDAVVGERNSIAHGGETADTVGRRYSKDEILMKIDRWETRWSDFIDWVEAQAVNREFYLLSR